MEHTQQIRYSRQINLPEIGEEGQQKLLDSRVLVVGAGGLGSPLLLYLAASGVGTIGIVDDDKVDLSNLGRQVAHETTDVGRLKVESASDAMLDLNPEVNVITHAERLSQENATEIIKEYDLVADGSDNFETRFLINDTCHRLHKTLVSASVLGFSGQLATFKSYLGGSHPCYRCFCPQLPPATNCSESGVLGPFVGLMGTWQATEVIKELLGMGKSLSGSVMLLDALAHQHRLVMLPKDPACPTCS